RSSRRLSENAADDLLHERQQRAGDLLEYRLEGRRVLPLRAGEKKRPTFRPRGGYRFEEGLQDRAHQLEKLGTREVVAPERESSTLRCRAQSGAHVRREVFGTGQVYP